MICGLSGGVDSSVAALLVHRAVGEQLTCVFVDHGLMRKDEGEQVVSTFRDTFKVPLVAVDAEARFLEKLKGVTDPEAKRKAIGAEFIRVFEEEAAKLGEANGGPGADGVRFLVQGTLYSDVIESGGGTGAATIKSHHNVGGLPDDLRVRAGGAAAGAVQGRGAGGRRRAGPARAAGLAPAVPRARAGDQDRRRRGHQGAPGPAARGRPHPPGGDPQGRASIASCGSPSACCRTCARSACRATSAPTATSWSCARSPATTR